MASAKNKVIKGDYVDLSVRDMTEHIYIGVLGIVEQILDKTTVANYEVLNGEQRKSGTSAVLRAGVGSAILGPVGLLAGISAKNKEIYTISIEFKNGKKSLIEIDGNLYKKFIQSMF